MEGKITFKSQTRNTPSTITSAKGPEAAEVCVLKKDKIVRREELYETEDRDWEETKS